MNIHANIEARKVAMTVLESAQNVIDKEKFASIDRFWEVLAEQAAKRCGREVRLVDPCEPVMEYDEALEFEEQIVPYGIHRGLKVREVPTPYWIATQESEFQRLLLRYMKSPRFRDVQSK